jgi:hypothetical protein
MAIQVLNFKVNTRGGKATHSVTIAIDKQLQLSGSIKTVKNYLHMPEVMPNCVINDELKQQLGYKTEAELQELRKVTGNPHLKSWGEEEIHIFEISMSRQRSEYKGKDRWNDHICWKLEGQRLDPRLNMQMKQILYKNIIEQVVNGNVTSTSSLPMTVDSEGNITMNEEYYEKIPKTMEVSFSPGRRLANGSPDWKNIIDEINGINLKNGQMRNNGYRGYGDVIFVINKATKMSLSVRAMIRQFKSGKWGLAMPGVNINRLRAAEVEGADKFINLEKEMLLPEVKYETLPDDLKKLVNPDNGRLFANTMEFVNVRGNNTIAHSDELNRDEEGAAIGPVQLVTGFVKKQVLTQFVEVLKQHGLSETFDIDGAPSEESYEALNAIVVGDVIEEKAQ